MKTLTVADAKEHIKLVIKEHLPVMLWGPPGIGKSSIIKEITQELGWQIIDLRLALLNPVDLRGLPIVNREKGIAEWLPPEFLPRDGKGILFLDEINAAPVSVQIAAYQLLLDRRVGNYVLPPAWRMIAAGNRESDKAHVNKLPSPLANRLVHLELKADVKGWKTWAMKAKLDPRVIGFIDFKNDLLSTLPDNDQKAFPTPRSWEFVSKILSIYPDVDEAKIMVEGAVGEGAAAELYAWLPTFSALPDALAILQGKSSVVPKKADVLTALITSLVSNLEVKYLPTFLDYTFKLQGEYAVLAVKEAISADWGDDLEKLPKWEAWADKYSDLIA